ncbi:MAG TPA: AI-2E family transporter, partial [Solirubrobacteraceae bacterium]|nr:AI-2E family transporter [Solirubrobacteraceae bacterium]
MASLPPRDQAVDAGADVAPGAVAGAGAPPRKPAGLVTPPQWLRDLGTFSWLVVGIALVTVAAIWVVTLTQTIVMPVIAAAVIAAVASPVVAWLKRHRVGRGAGAALVLVGMALLVAGVILLVVGGVLSQTDDLGGHLSSAQDTLAGWLRDLGVSQSEAQQARDDVGKAVSDAVPALLGGVVGGIGAVGLILAAPLTSA